MGAIAFLVAGAGGARGAGLDVSVVSPLEHVFPDGAPPGEPGARVEAARGEWEPFQIVVRAPAGEALANVRALAAPLDGPERASVAAPRLYRVEYLPVRTPSSIEGHAGRWPDALVPDVDAYAGEKRRAFPFDVPAGETRAIWVELFVPPGTPPGVYRGAVTVAADRGEARVPVELTVHGFTLPATSSLPVTFGFASNALPRAHGPLDDAQLAALARRYALAALRHRVSLHGGTMEPPPWTIAADGRVTIDFRAYDAEVGPFLDGTADRGGPSDGARWTAIDLRVPERLDGAARDRYVAQMIAHLRARGWLDRAFDYTFDEPNDAAFAKVRARAERLHRAAPEIPRLVTHERAAGLDGAVEIWCPLVNRVDDKPDNPPPPPRADYGRLWWYQSCMSHGCDIVGGDYFTGWPSLAVDAPPIAHRIFEWLTFRYRVGGELYYNTVEAYAAGRDPWRDQLLHGGNGDGTLFYPGLPERIGGRTPIPVESIRLKLIREGLEDYEYLRLYAARAGAAQAEALAASIAPRTFRWQHDPRRLFAARHEIATVLDGDAHARERPVRLPWRVAPTARRCAPGAEAPNGCGKL
ncbi:MAG TPA: glycoside hydrolase domain-containing protein [Polyangia bacterium]|nr:glycoside hydrolase domain-containing protein [Polyangia bacterium]